MKFSLSIVVATLTFFAAGSAVAQEHEEEVGQESTVLDAADEHGSRNHAGPFIGATRSDLHNTVSFTAGFDYIRKFRNGEWGVGAIGEVVFADKPEYVFIVPVYREFGPWYVRSGPGFEYVSAQEEGEDGDGDARSLSKASGEEPENDDSAGDETGGEMTALLRVGIGYEVEIKDGWSITPSFDLDFGGRRNRFAVFGATIGKGF